MLILDYLDYIQLLSRYNKDSLRYERGGESRGKEARRRANRQRSNVRPTVPCPFLQTDLSYGFLRCFLPPRDDAPRQTSTQKKTIQVAYASVLMFCDEFVSRKREREPKKKGAIKRGQAKKGGTHSYTKTKKTQNCDRDQTPISMPQTLIKKDFNLAI